MVYTPTQHGTSLQNVQQSTLCNITYHMLEQVFVVSSFNSPAYMEHW